MEEGQTAPWSKKTPKEQAEPLIHDPSQSQAAAARVIKRGEKTNGIASSFCLPPKTVMKIHSYTLIRGSIDVPGYNISIRKQIIARKGTDFLRI